MTFRNSLVLWYFLQKGIWPIAGMTTPAFDQDSYIYRDDDDNEANATNRQLKNVDDTLEVDTNYRMRFLIQETASGMANNQTPQLEYRHDSGGGFGAWTAVNASSSVVQSSASANFADGDDTTQQVGSGTFITPNSGMDEVEGLAGGAAMDFAGSDEVEVEYCFQIQSGDVADTDTIELRCTMAGTPFGTYTNTPSITVNEGGPTTETFFFPVRRDRLAPTYRHGFARSPAESARPQDWSGLVGLWAPHLGPSGTVLQDLSAYKNHGTLQTMDPSTDWVIGELGYHLDLDGSDDYISIGDQAVLEGSAIGISICILVKIDDLNGLADIGMGYVSKWLSDADGSWIMFGGSNGDILFRVVNASVSPQDAVIIAADLEIDRWFYIVGTWRDGGTVDLYLDGVFNDSSPSTLAGPVNSSTAEVRIGRYTTPFLPGQVAQVRIYNRALSPSLIREQYQDLFGIVRQKRRFSAVPEQVVVSELGAQLHADTAEIAEALVRALTMSRFATEQIDIAESTVQVLALVRDVAETGEISEATLLAFGLTRISPETAELTEAVALVVGRTKSVNETAELTEQISRVIGSVRLVPETFNLVEAVTTVMGLVRQAQDSLSVDEVTIAARVMTRLRLDTAELSETVSLLVGRARQSLDNLDVSEQTAAARALTRLVGETATLAEVVSIALGLVREGQETAAISEGAIVVPGRIREGIDTATLVEAVVLALGLVREAADTFEIGEQIQTVLELTRQAQDTLAVSEGLVLVRDLGRLVSETAEFSELVQVVQARVRGAADIAEISELVIAFRSLTRMLDETSSITEQVELTVGRVRLSPDTAEISEQISIALGLVREAADTLSVAESTVIALEADLIKLGPDTLELNENISLVLSFVQASAETLSMAENSVSSRAMTRIVAEQATMTEGFTVSRALTISLVETLEIAEAVIKNAALVKFLTETMSIGEGVVTFSPGEAIIDLTMPFRSLDLILPEHDFDLAMPFKSLDLKLPEHDLDLTLPARSLDLTLS